MRQVALGVFFSLLRAPHKPFQKSAIGLISVNQQAPGDSRWFYQFNQETRARYSVRR